MHFFFILTAIVLQAFKLGSSCVFAVFSLGSLTALFLNTLLNAVFDGDMTDIPLISYIVAQIAPLVIGTELIVGLMTIFVPLTGRLGEVSQQSRRLSPTKSELTKVTFGLVGAGRTYHRSHEFGHELLRPLVPPALCAQGPAERAPSDHFRPTGRDIGDHGDVRVRDEPLRSDASKTRFCNAL